MKELIKSFVERNSYMEHDESGSVDNVMAFATRENGDVGEEIYSQIDLKEAVNIKKQLKTEFGTKLSIHIEPVDEWIHMEVTINNNN